MLSFKIMEENIKKGEQTQEVSNVEEIKKERDEYLDGWKRAKADLINYKKEEMHRLESFTKFSNEAIMLEMLQVLDSFDLGLSIIKEDDPARKGVILIQSQMKDIMKRHGLERIEVKKGDQLDTNLHEAIEEVNSDAPPGTVSEEVTAGYKLHGKTIRPARVKVSKKQ